MSYDIGLLLDGLILVFLCVTIFYAARLSIFLKSFREGRNGVQLLIRDLSITVDKAQESIQEMKIHAQETENQLIETINEAKFLSDELKFMTETGDSLADRLEKIANRNRELIDLIEGAGGIGTQKVLPVELSNPATKPKKKHVEVEDSFEISDFDIDEDDERDFLALNDGAYREEEIEQTHRQKVNTQSKSKLRSFAIFDRDYLEGEDANDDYEIDSVIDEETEDLSGFHSQAEKDLYEALQRKKRAGSRVSEIT